MAPAAVRLQPLLLLLAVAAATAFPALANAATATAAARPPVHRVMELLHWSPLWFKPAPEESVDCTAQCGRRVTVHPHRSRLGRASALVFHAWDLNLTSADLPPRLHGSPPWVLRSQESPVTCRVQSRPEVAAMFNLTMTYRFDSDAPAPYVPPSAEWLFASPHWPASAADATAPAGGAKVAYVASHCGAASGRDEYVRELGRHIAVDALGRCLNNASLPAGLGRYDPGGRGDAMDALMRARGYRFVLAFENSRCDDYVTEKLYNPLRAGVVPVYRGAPNARSAGFLPSPLAAVLADDFGSPRELAEHLHEMLRDERLYARRLEWYRQRRVDAALLRRIESLRARGSPWCDVCRAVVEGRSHEVTVDRSCLEAL